MPPSHPIIFAPKQPLWQSLWRRFVALLHTPRGMIISVSVGAVIVIGVSSLIFFRGDAPVSDLLSDPLNLGNTQQPGSSDQPAATGDEPKEGEDKPADDTKDKTGDQAPDTGAGSGGGSGTGSTGGSSGGSGGSSSGGGSTPTPTTPPVTNVLGWLKTRSNTGLTSVGLSCDSLPAYSGSDVIPAGTTISGKRFTGHVWVYQGNITIERSCFKPTSVGAGMPLVSTTDFNGSNGVAPNKVTIRDSDFDGSLLGDYESAMSQCFAGIADLINNYCSGFGSGLALFNTGSSLSSLVEGNYVTGMTAWGDASSNGNHSDGFTIRDFTAASNSARQAVIRNNRFDTRSDNTTGSFFIQSYSGRIDNVFAEGNLIEGWGWNMGLNELNYAYSGIHITNNRFTGSAGGAYGAAYYQGGSGYTTWSENYINNSSAASNKGAVISEP